MLNFAVSLDPVTVAFSALVGQLLCCTLFGLIAFVEFTDSVSVRLLHEHTHSHAVLLRLSVGSDSRIDGHLFCEIL